MMGVLSQIVAGVSLTDDVADTINELLSVKAESLGFRRGLSDGTTTEAHRQAFITMLQGGVVEFGPYTYYCNWATQLTNFLTGDLVMRGVKGKTKLIFENNQLPANALFNMRHGSLILDGLELVNQNLPGIGTAGKSVVFVSDLDADISHIEITNCKLVGWETGLLASTSNPAIDRKLEYVNLSNNVVRNRGGLSRVYAIRFDFARICNNNINCGRSGIRSGYGGVVFGYVQNTGLGMFSHALGHVQVSENWIKNVRPTSDPGSAGNYGLLVNARSVFAFGNHISNVFYEGNTNESEVIWVSDGVSKTFSATLSQLPLVDTLTLTATGLAANDEQANYRADAQFIKGTGIAETTSTAQITGTLTSGSNTITAVTGLNNCFVGQVISGGGLPADSYITAIDSGAGTLTIDNRQRAAQTGAGVGVTLTVGDYISYVSYNDRKVFVSLANPLPNGTQVTAAYKRSLTGAPANIEPLYVKAGFIGLIGNTLVNCGGQQAYIGCKGGGSLGYLKDNGDAIPGARGSWQDTYNLSFSALESYTGMLGGFEGGAGSAYGGVVAFNRINHPVYVGAFDKATAFWLQMDNLLVHANVIDGITDQCARTNFSSERGRAITISQNIIRRFRGNRLFYNPNDLDTLNLIDNVVSALRGSARQITFLELVNAAAQTPSPGQNADQVGPLCNSKRIKIRGLEVDSDFSSGITMSILKVNTAAGTESNIKISDVDIACPWQFESKLGAGTGGKRVFMDYSTSNNTGKQVLSGGGAATAQIYDDNGHI